APSTQNREQSGSCPRGSVPAGAAAAAVAELAAGAAGAAGGGRVVLGHVSLLQVASSMPAFIRITQAHSVHYTDKMDGGTAPAPWGVLLENPRAFLGYLERRVGARALAEDILQAAFAKVIDRPEQAPADDSVVPWFYRTLRNAAIDRFRR